MKFSIIYLFASICIFLFSCNSGSNADKLFTQAEELEMMGRYLDAIRVLNKAIEADPNFLGAYINRGADFSMINDYTEAISNYKEVLKRDPHNELALFNIGNNYKRLNKYEEALETYNKILIHQNSNKKNEFHVPLKEICYERGLTNYELENYSQAVSDFQYCIDQNYLITDNRYMLGATFEMLKKNELACEQYTLAANSGDQDAKQARKRVCYTKPLFLK